MRETGLDFVGALDWCGCTDSAPLGAARATPVDDVELARLEDEDGARAAIARKIWAESRSPLGTVVVEYLASRRLFIPEEIASEVIRFHPALYFDGERVGGMVVLFRDIKTNEPRGIHRTFLDGSGRKLARRMLGPTGNAAIKLDADEKITVGLHIGEGVETCLAGRLARFHPAWALGSAGAIAAFPVLSGIDAITVLGEVGDGGVNARAADACKSRWEGARRDFLFVIPEAGGDLNDVWCEAAR